MGQAQLFLRTYFYYYKGEIDSIKGYGTSSAIAAYQKGQGLNPDSIWGYLTDCASQSNIRAIQRKLNSLGFDCGEVDGVIGPKFLSALELFQKNKGLTTDRIIGPDTYKAMFGTSLSSSLSSLPSGYISQHFKKSEFACECGGKWCDGYNGKEVSPKLLDILEYIRSYYGRPVIITSGIRCQRYNDSLSGSIPNSVHIYGGAADIYIPGVTITASGRAGVKQLAYQKGAAYCYYGTAGMGNAVHINV